MDVSPNRPMSPSWVALLVAVVAVGVFAYAFASGGGVVPALRDAAVAVVFALLYAAAYNYLSRRG